MNIPKSALTTSSRLVVIPARILRKGSEDIAQNFKDMFDLKHPFFVPLWRRVVTVTLTLGWAVFELVLGNPGWALIFGAAGAWTVYQFFVVWASPEEDEE